MSTCDTGVSHPPPITVVLKGQMNCGGYLQIDENGVVKILEKPPNDQNQFTFHEITTWKSGKQLVRFQCVSHPTKYLTGNKDTYVVHGEPTLLFDEKVSDKKLSDDSEWEIKNFTIIKEEAPPNWKALYHPNSHCYFVIMKEVENGTRSKLVYGLTDNLEEVKEYGAFVIYQIVK